MNKIDKTDTLAKILSQRQFSVDVFQREYRWGRKQIEQMISDFQDTFEEYYDPETHDTPAEVKMRAALTIPVGAARFLLLLIKLALVPIGPKLDAWYPRRRPAHLLTNCFQRYILATLNDQFIMDMPADEAVGQCAHGVGQDMSIRVRAR